MKAVVLLSGGLDSTTLAYHIKEAFHPEELTALSFDYGQRHGRKELVAAGNIAGTMGISHEIVRLGVRNNHAYMGYDAFHEASKSSAGDDRTVPLAAVLGGSSLTDSSVPVPDGHYAEETMKATVVPNRNAIMLSIAYGVAIGRGAELVAFAAHSGDHAIYPDCRPDFVAALNTTLRMGNEWAKPRPVIVGPFLEMSKADIARRASELNVPIAETWSCYKGGDIHCGTCGTCYERREAFELAQVPDPTPYLDSTTRFAAPSPS